MKRTRKRAKRKVRLAPTLEPIKLTALLYLRESLLQEKYERCLGLVALAKEFGATNLEISHLLEDPRRVPS